MKGPSTARTTWKCGASAQPRTRTDVCFLLRPASPRATAGNFNLDQATPVGFDPTRIPPSRGDGVTDLSATTFRIHPRQDPIPPHRLGNRIPGRSSRHKVSIRPVAALLGVVLRRLDLILPAHRSHEGCSIPARMRRATGQFDLSQNVDGAERRWGRTGRIRWTGSGSGTCRGNDCRDGRPLREGGVEKGFLLPSFRLGG